MDGAWTVFSKRWRSDARGSQTHTLKVTAIEYLEDGSNVSSDERA